MDIFHCFVVLLHIQLVTPWDLSHIGIEKYSIRHISIFHNHAYISIMGCEFNNTCPTLIEAPWPKNSVYSVKPRAFQLSKFIVRNSCDYLQNVISTDIDVFGRLWVLDDGNSILKCPRRLIVYNLYTQQVLFKYLFNERNLKPSSIIVDGSHWNNVAYIGISNKNAMFICTYKSKKCSLYYLEDSLNKNVMSGTEELALSKKDDSLYISSEKSMTMHIVYLQDIMKQISMEKKNSTINAHYLGEKLGPSRGLLSIDTLDILCYYLSRDYAIVCWHKKKPLMAETHDILIQSYKILPNVQQLLLDAQNNMWAINNPDEQLKQMQKYPQKKKYNANSINTKIHINPTSVKIIKFDQLSNIPIFSL